MNVSWHIEDWTKFVVFLLTEGIKEEPMTPMSSSSMGEGSSSDIKPPIPEPIPQPSGSSEKKKKCCE